MAAYGHTLPTFDLTTVTGDATQTITSDDAGSGSTITLTIDSTGGAGSWSHTNASVGGATDDLVFYNSGSMANGSSLVTVSFDSPVSLASFVFIEPLNADSGFYTFTVTGGTGTTFTVDSNTLLDMSGTHGGIVTPPDWTSVTSFTVTYSLGNFMSGFDTFVYEAVAEPAPVIDDTPRLLTGDESDNALNGAAGDDTITGGAGDDNVSGGAGNDILYAGADDNGNDTISGGKGSDTIGGGAGNDFIEGDDGSDTLYGGAGDDIIYATSFENENGDFSSNVAWGGMGNDSLFGGLGDDILGGGVGNDYVSGGRGDDEMFGGAGDDTLVGGQGNDTLYGGRDADTFVFASRSGDDRINRFNISEDVLDLQNADASFENVADVEAATSLTSVNGTSGILIDLGGGNSLFLASLVPDDVADLNLVL